MVVMPALPQSEERHQEILRGVDPIVVRVVPPEVSHAVDGEGDVVRQDQPDDPGG